MPDKTSPRLYALVHSTGQSASSDHASLHAAAALAGRCGGTVHALLATDAANAEAVTRLAGNAGAAAIASVLLPDTEGDLQAQQLADVFVALINDAAASSSSKDGALFLVSAGTMTEEISGAIAARTGALPLGRPSHLEFQDDGTLHVTRSSYGGRLDVKQAVGNGPCIAAVRAPEAGSTAQSAEEGMAKHTLACPPLSPAYPKTVGVQTETEANLEGARLIVSGGRGMSNEQGFELLRQLAQKLDGALGGSLPAVDAGWASVSRQVGQSGKYVTPEIYLAVGISGTPQHLAGVDPHSRIIAINKDPDAPIFQVARVGVLAPWEEFLPALLEAVEKNTASSRHSA